MMFKKMGWCLVLMVSWVSGLHAETNFSHGRFENVRVFAPSAQVSNVAIYAADSSGWQDQDKQNTAALNGAGVLVIALDTAQFFKAMEEDSDECEFPDGDIENLSHFIQAYYKLPTYKRPFLIGTGDGAAFVFSTFAQAPADIFAGLLTVDFCQELRLHKPVCAGEGLKLSKKNVAGFYTLSNDSTLAAPWHAVISRTPSQCSQQSDVTFKDLVDSRFVTDSTLANKLMAAYEALTKVAVTRADNSTQALVDLPLELVPAANDKSDTMALFLSGDGGWAGLDKEVASQLAAQGIPVVGWDSLRYFWTTRTPNELANDAQRILNLYMETWHKKNVILLGYSQGANVLPFLLNRLPKETQNKVSLTVLMSLDERADFEFHLSNWVSNSETQGVDIAPEINKLPAIPVLCFYGEDDDESACPRFNSTRVKAVKLSGDHHFDGAYAHLAELIINAAQKKSP
ncbi:MAG TPA: AcvB/VirJ family lysyl-phosphatidylglycerol hydrolase [Pseudomonadales bacterium]|nr:AcvB/VirJ family lysyl-phosphatidylglycerol hydrolase [Pseudomonadales bacterium]